MADLKKKSTLKIARADVTNLIQTHYPNLYSKLSSTTIVEAYVDNTHLVIIFAEADDGSQLV